MLNQMSFTIFQGEKSQNFLYLQCNNYKTKCENDGHDNKEHIKIAVMAWGVEPSEH